MNRKLPALIIAGIVFIFAGYNLWSYFDGKAEEEAEANRQAEIQKIEADKQRQRQAKIAKEARQEKQRLAQERQQRIADEQEKKRTLEVERIAKIEAEKEAKRLARAEKKQQKEVERLASKLKKRRTPQIIEGFSDDAVDNLSSMSPRYYIDNPKEALDYNYKKGRYKRGRKLLADNTNILMFYSALNNNKDYIQTFLDIGIDINATNKKGVSAFHFASAYNTPEVIKLLADNKADISAKSYLKDMNALHLASWLNPNPESIKALVELGLPIEGKVGGLTPIIIATKNSNLEVVETLIDLGADTSVYDDEGKTLHYLIKTGSYRGFSKDEKNKVLERVKL